MPLRVHLADLLLNAGARDESVRHAAAALERDPSSQDARDLLLRATAPQAAGAEPDAGFDWRRAEAQLDSSVPPMFVSATRADEPPAFDVEHSGITLADVGGMENVKQRLESAFLAPMRNLELRGVYGKSLRGGLLLYGPPDAARPSWLAPSPASSARPPPLGRGQRSAPTRPIRPHPARASA